MMTILGACLVGGGCATLGLLKSTQMKQEGMLVGEGIETLRYLHREITQNHRPLPLLLQELGTNAPPSLRGFYKGCFEELSQESGKPFYEIWKGNLKELSGGLAEEFAPLGRVLGQYEAHLQERAILTVTERLEEKKRQLEQEYRRNQRVYPTLGVTAGIFFIILLL